MEFYVVNDPNIIGIVVKLKTIELVGQIGVNENDIDFAFLSVLFCPISKVCCFMEHVVLVSTFTKADLGKDVTFNFSVDNTVDRLQALKFVETRLSKLTLVQKTTILRRTEILVVQRLNIDAITRRDTVDLIENVRFVLGTLTRGKDSSTMSNCQSILIVLLALLVDGFTIRIEQLSKTIKRVEVDQTLEILVCHMLGVSNSFSKNTVGLELTGDTNVGKI